MTENSIAANPPKRSGTNPVGTSETKKMPDLAH